MTSTHTDAFPSTAGSTEIEVELRRLDYYLPQIRFASKVLLKIDVQGYSLEVLRGAPDTLARTDLVVVETSVVTLYEGEARFQDVYELLTETGFEFIGVLDQLNHPRTGEVLQMDAMFRRRGSERF